MALPIGAFWDQRDRQNWTSIIATHRRNCVFICRYGKSCGSLEEVMRWPLSFVRLVVDDIVYWLGVEEKNSRRT